MQDFVERSDAEFEDPLSDYEPTSYSSPLECALAEETVDALESRPFLHVRPSASIQQAIQAMSAAHSSSLLVVDEGRLVGIFTERDVLEKVAEQYPRLASHAVEEVMTTDPAVIFETDPVAAAVASIAVAGHRHVPVLGINGELMGMIGPRKVFDFVVDNDK